MGTEEGIFKHQCVHPDCDKVIEFDDEPWCFEPSPDEGSSLVGWSAREALSITALTVAESESNIQKSNIFDKRRD